MKTKHIVILSLFLLALFACEEKDIHTYSGEDGIYFNKRERVGDILTDSTNFTFIYVDEGVNESVVSIPLQLVGKESPQDRPVNIKVVGGTAVEGTDFVLPSNPAMPADKSSFMLEVTLKRTSSLKAEPKTIELAIEENSHFRPIITHETIDSEGTKVTALRHKIEFSEQFVKGAAPAAWVTQMIAFTPERFFLVCKVMDIPRSDFNDTSKISSARFQYLVTETMKYVAEQLMSDNPDPEIFDEEGDPIF